jgi:hypothetical protein
MIANRWTALAVLTFARTAMGFQFRTRWGARRRRPSPAA